jgi:acyl carrier protein
LAGATLDAMIEPFGQRIEGRPMRTELREIVGAHGKLTKPIATISDDADLFSAGLDSLAVVNIMLAIEDMFEVEFRDDLLNRASFSSIVALENAVRASQAS